MAADRKRTRAQRRREREQAQGARNPRPREADEPAAAPDPLAGGTPYVDEAQLAERGAGHTSPEGEGPIPSPDAGEPGGAIYEDERDVAAAPDLLEDDFAPEHAAPAGQPTQRGRRGRFITFLGHCVDELRRVQWPDRRQVGQGTAVTLGFVVLAGGYLGLMDAIWKPLVEAIL